VTTLGTTQYSYNLLYIGQSSDKIYFLCTNQLVKNCNTNPVNSNREYNGIHHNLTFHKKIVII